MLILILCAVSEITFLVTRFSRFSEEIFMWIIAIFFTYEATKSIIGVRSGVLSLTLRQTCTARDTALGVCLSLSVVYY